MTLFHVTFTRHVERIRVEGVVPNRRRVWRNAFGEKLGTRGFVYAFTERNDAELWAGKQSYDHAAECSVVEIDDDASAWTADDLTVVHGARGVRKYGAVEAHKVINAYPVTRDVVRAAIANRDRKKEVPDAL